MSRAYPEHPRVGVGAVVIDRGRVLLVRRVNPPLAGEWSLPGGALELGETLRDCAAREALEETGLTVEVGELLGVFDRVMPDARGKVEYHYVLVDFLCRVTGGALRAGCDASDARWFTREEAAEVRLMNDTAGIVTLAFDKTRLRYGDTA